MAPSDDSVPAEGSGDPRRPDGEQGDASGTEVTSYAPWTAKDSHRAAEEARILELREDQDGSWTRDEAPEVEEIVVEGERSEREHHQQHRRRGEPFEFVTPADAPTRGARPHPHTQSPPVGPGLAGLFGAGTPLGEATGLRLRPRKRWLAAVLGVVFGAVGAQSFYTGRLFRGGLQLSLVISSWMLALLTLGLLVPLAEAVSLVVWIWGAVEGVRYLIARSGPFAYDALGGPLE